MESDSDETQPTATMTVAETAVFLRIGIQSTYRGIASGQIPAVRIGARILVPRRALERMLEASDDILNR
jgi:excisionase family DNA binding protein